MKYLFLFFSCLAIIVIACNKQTTEPENNKTELLPLKTGNYWIYRVGVKDSYRDTVFSFKDTLKVIDESEKGFWLQSSLQVILKNGYYRNGADGLYMNDTLQFKFPGNPGEYCGLIGLGNIVDINGQNPYGIISRTDYNYRFIKDGDTISLPDCYYYFLNSFYQSDYIKTTGYTIFKPGIGMVARDWADINELNNEFYNPFASLIDYNIK